MGWWVGGWFGGLVGDYSSIKGMECGLIELTRSQESTVHKHTIFWIMNF